MYIPYSRLAHEKNIIFSLQSSPCMQDLFPKRGREFSANIRLSSSTVRFLISVAHRAVGVFLAKLVVNQTSRAQVIFERLRKRKAQFSPIDFSPNARYNCPNKNKYGFKKHFRIVRKLHPMSEALRREPRGWRSWILRRKS